MTVRSPAAPTKSSDTDADLSAFLAKSNMRDRVSVVKHLATCDAESDPRHAALFRRLFAKMSTLAPMPLRAAGSLNARFYIADGKYRMQVFALEDQRDGSVTAYFPDVLADAVEQKWLLKHKAGFAATGSPDDVLPLEQMDETHPPNPPEHVKHLTGWNRKAVKLTVKVSAAHEPHAALVEQLCDLAARKWASQSA